MLHIVTDSSANIPESLTHQRGVHVIPTYIYMADKTLRDGVDITPSEMVHYLQRGGAPLSTSEPPLNDFTALYERILHADPPASILSLHVSGAISGTMASAQRAAAHFPEADIRLIDTRSCTAGHALLVMEAAALAAENRSADEIEATLCDLRDEHTIYFALGTTDMLRDAGRLWRLARMARGEIKPTITLRHGVIEGVNPHRTLEAAYEEITRLAEEAAADHTLKVALTYGADDSYAAALAERLTTGYNAEIISMQPLCATFMYYFTPGALGIAWV